MPLSLNIAIAVAILPYMSYAYEKKDHKSILKNLQMALLVTVLIAFPCAFGMGVFAEPILKLVFPNASAGANILVAISPLIVFAVCAQTVNSALQGIGDYRTPVIALIIGVVIKTILNIILIPIESIGIYGATISSILCHAIALIIAFVVLKNKTGFKFDGLKLVIKPLIASILMSVISYASYYGLSLVISSKIATVIGIFVAVIVYGIFILLLKVFSKEDLKDLPFGNKLSRFAK